MRWRELSLLSLLLLASGCVDDPGAVKDVTPPAVPRGLVSVTGDHTAYLSWLDNREPDLAGYRVYASGCPDGPACKYLRAGATEGNAFTVSALANGVTSYFAVSAVDDAGNESELSYELVQDTPRPEGFGQALEDYYLAGSPASGWDFSSYSIRSWDDPQVDIFFGYNGSVFDMFVPDYVTDIQDAGVANTLDAVDIAPVNGWAPSGSVELIEGHCYVVWTRDDNYAKFRVARVLPPAGARPAEVVFDWAYQVATGVRELRARPVRPRTPGARPPTWSVARSVAILTPN